MAIPSLHSLLLPVLELGTNGKVRVRDAVQSISDQFNLSDEEREARLPSGTQTRISNRTNWAVSHLVKAGLLGRPEIGCFTITDEGKKVLSTKPDSISIAHLKKLAGFKEFLRPSKKQKVSIQTGGTTEEDQTPEEKIDSAYEQLYADLKDKILAHVLGTSPRFFERLLISLLVAMGYGGSLKNAGKHVGKSSDEGIDAIIKQDKLGLDIIYVQAKRYATENPIGRPQIQSFVGSLDGKKASKGIFITTSSFTRQAREYAQDTSKRLILVDGEKLVNLMIEHNVGVRLKNSIELKKIDEDFFQEE